MQDTALVLHDTTEFSYQRAKPDDIGATRIITARKKVDGRLERHTICGLLMHSSLVVTTDGIPLGIAAIKFWTRKKFKGCNELKRHINSTRIPIQEKESYRWIENLKQSTKRLDCPDRCVHIGDRESDIYELFCTAKEIGNHFLIRTCVDRLADDGKHTVSQEMNEIKVNGLHRIEVRNNKGEASQATLELRYKKVTILPPIGKQKNYPEQSLTVIHAVEKNKPKNREKISWKLVTDLPINSCKDVIEKLNWYALRWKIETFHKILKSGCKAEASKLRTAERLTKLLSVFCILSWRIFWMTMLNRFDADVDASLALTKIEINILEKIANGKKKLNKKISKKIKPLSYYLIQIAKLGGYLARASDPPPGNMVVWRGMTRLSDIILGASLEQDICG